MRRLADYAVTYSRPFIVAAVGTAPLVLLLVMGSKPETAPAWERVAASFMPAIMAIVYLVIGMPIVGFLCARTSDASRSIWLTLVAGLAGILVMALVLSVALFLTGAVAQTLEALVEALAGPPAATLLPGVPFLIGFSIGALMGRRGRAGEKWPSDPDQPALAAPLGHTDLGGHH